MRAVRLLPAVLSALVLAALAAAAASAGPWPREAGSGFAALALNTGPGIGPLRAVSVRTLSVRAGEAYLELGASPRLVLGGALAHGPDGPRRDLFARWHPRDLPGGLAWGLTAGLRLTPEVALQRRIMAGVDLGRGFDTALGNLWLRAGVRVLSGHDGRARRMELDLSTQAGLRHGPWVGMVGLTQYRTHRGTQTRLRPALGRELSPRLTLLGEAALVPGAGLDELRLVLWSRF